VALWTAGTAMWLDGFLRTCFEARSVLHLPASLAGLTCAGLGFGFPMLALEPAWLRWFGSASVHGTACKTRTAC
jgi:hypothetical protein